MQLLLHKKTSLRFDQIVSRPPHGILITGKTGSGKSTLAENLAAKLLNISVESVSSHPYMQLIDPKEATISIDDIRELQNFLKLRVPGKNNVKRIIIIKDAARMRSEAQNALLKTLEEPPEGTVLILTAPTADALLPTISSRTQTLEVLPVSKDDALEYYGSQGFSTATLTKSYALSMGQAGLLHALVHEADHPLVLQVETAKSLLAKSPAERLLMTEELSKDKAAIALLFDALTRICHAALTASGHKLDTPRLMQWHEREQATLAAHKSLRSNANTKLLLDHLFLSL